MKVANIHHSDGNSLHDEIESMKIHHSLDVESIVIHHSEEMNGMQDKINSVRIQHSKKLYIIREANDFLSKEMNTNVLLSKEIFETELLSYQTERDFKRHLVVSELLHENSSARLKQLMTERKKSVQKIDRLTKKVSLLTSHILHLASIPQVSIQQV